MVKKQVKKTKPKKNKKKYRLKYKNIIIFLIIFLVFYGLIYVLLNLPITNIYIINNHYLKDQEIIEIAGIENYPSTLKNNSNIITQKLKENIYIKNVKVYKKGLTKVYIKVTENRPLFYNASNNKTILLDGRETSDKKIVPILINYVPDTIYSKFVEQMGNIDVNILSYISEIEYNPNDVDDTRFLLTMNDDNYVYLSLYKFDAINSYIEIMKRFKNQKGILYLDSGEYFKVFKD